MPLDPITAGLDLAKGLLDKFIPDKDAANKAKVELELAYLNAEINSQKDQAEVNKVEAASNDAYTSRARPTIIYICGVGLLWIYFLSPFLSWLALVRHWTVTLPVIPMEGLFTLLFSVLGLGGFRTIEKIRDAQSSKTKG